MPNKPSIAILSIGDMGSGVARLLTTHKYPVYSLLNNRSPATQARAKSAGVQSSATAHDLIHSASLIFSIVPPRDALATAALIADAVGKIPERAKAITYFDLNATSPKLSHEVGGVLKAVGVRYVDGGIIGGPPRLKDDGSWAKPSIVFSGPSLAECMGDESTAEELGALLNFKSVGDQVGAASGLKMCFASLTKGLTAIGCLSFSTASQLGVLGPLREHLAEYAPAIGKAAENGVVGCQPKAYRWVKEMEEIAATFDDAGGWGLGEEREDGKKVVGNMFRGAAEVYRTIDNETDLGAKKRPTMDEVADVLGGALKKRRKSV